MPASRPWKIRSASPASGFMPMPETEVGNRQPGCTPRAAPAPEASAGRRSSTFKRSMVSSRSPSIRVSTWGGAGCEVHRHRKRLQIAQPTPEVDHGEPRLTGRRSAGQGTGEETEQRGAPRPGLAQDEEVLIGPGQVQADGSQARAPGSDREPRVETNGQLAVGDALRKDPDWASDAPSQRSAMASANAARASPRPARSSRPVKPAERPGNASRFGGDPRPGASVGTVSATRRPKSDSIGSSRRRSRRVPKASRIAGRSSAQRPALRARCTPY